MGTVISERSAQVIARERYTSTLRGRPARAFGSLAWFAATVFLASGLYLIVSTWLNPVEAQAASLIVGACAVALGAILLVHLWPAPARRRRNGQPG